MKRYIQRMHMMIEDERGGWVKYEDVRAYMKGCGAPDEARDKGELDRENLDKSDMSLVEIMQYRMGLEPDENLAQVIADAAKELSDRDVHVELTWKILPKTSRCEEHKLANVTITQSVTSQ